MLDNPHRLTEALWEAHPVFPFVFCIFAFLSALTVMNMLIGVLCAVVTAVASAEKEALSTDSVKSKLQYIMKRSGLDASGDGEISKTELSGLLGIPSACQ